MRSILPKCAPTMTNPPEHRLPPDRLATHEDHGMNIPCHSRYYALGLSITFCLVATASAQAGVDLPDGAKLDKVDFERHVMGLFGKTGCNNGSCHGSFQGKNGFRLSLFGYEPARDFAALTREIQGRRINTVDPDSSLLLQKAT